MLHNRRVFEFYREGIFPFILAKNGLAMRKCQYLTTARPQESNLFLDWNFVVRKPVLGYYYASTTRKLGWRICAEVVLVELNLRRILKLAYHWALPKLSILFVTAWCWSTVMEWYFFGFRRIQNGLKVWGCAMGSFLFRLVYLFSWNRVDRRMLICIGLACVLCAYLLGHEFKRGCFTSWRFIIIYLKTLFADSDCSSCFICWLF